MKKTDQKDKKKINSFIRYSGLAFEMMGMIALSTFLGYKIDQWMDNSFRIFTLLFLVFSVPGSIFYAIRKLPK